MIYIKNTTETQTIFIPRNELQKEAYVTSTKTYEDGYREGLEDGKEQQKDQLLNLYVTENGQYEREDGWGVVTVDVPIGECPECDDCDNAYNEGYKNGYKQGQSDCPECDDCSGAYDEGYEIGKNEGYEGGFQDGYEQGKSDCPECDECPELTSINITKNGSYEGAFKLVNVDVPNEGGSCKLTETSINLNKESATIIASNEGFDGYSKVTVSAWAYGDVRYAEGYEQGQADCPELTSITITENGRYEGAYNVVNVNIDTQADCPSVQEQMNEYYYNPITVADSGFGEWAEDFKISPNSLFYKEENYYLNTDEITYLPTDANKNIVLTNKPVTDIIGLPFDSADYQYISLIKIGSGVERVNIGGVIMSNITTIVMGEDMYEFTSMDSAYPKLHTIIARGIINLDFNYSEVADNGTLWVNENNQYKERLLAQLPNGWELKIITDEMNILL